MSINFPPYQDDYLGGQYIDPFNLCCSGQEPVFTSRIITDTLFFTIVQYNVKGELNPAYLALNVDGLVGSTPQSAISQYGTNALPLLPPLDNTVSTLVPNEKARDCCDPCGNKKFPQHLCPIASRKNTQLYGQNYTPEQLSDSGDISATVSQREIDDYFGRYVPIYLDPPDPLNSIRSNSQYAIPYGTNSNDLVTFYPSFSKINTGQANKDPYNRLIIDSENLIRGVTQSCSKLSYLVISRDSLNDLLKHINSIPVKGYIANELVRQALQPLNIDPDNLTLNGFWIKTCGCQFEFMTTDLQENKLISKSAVSKETVAAILKNNWKHEKRSYYRKLYEVCSLRKIPLVDSLSTILKQINKKSRSIPPYCIEWRLEKNRFLVPFVWSSRLEVGIQPTIMENVLRQSGWMETKSQQFRHGSHEIKLYLLPASNHSNFGGTMVEATPHDMEYFTQKIIKPHRWRTITTKTSTPLSDCLVAMPKLTSPGFELIGDPKTLQTYFPDNISVETEYSKVFINETIATIKESMLQAGMIHSSAPIGDSVPFIFKNSPAFLCKDSTIWMDSQYIPLWEHEIASKNNWQWKVGDIELKDEVIQVVYDSDEHMTIYGSVKSLETIHQTFNKIFDEPTTIQKSFFKYRNPQSSDMIPILIEEWEKLDEEPESDYYSLWQHRKDPHRHLTTTFKKGVFRVDGELEDVQEIDRNYRIDQDIRKLEGGVSSQEKREILEKELDKEITVIPTGISITILPLCGFEYENCPFTESFQVIGDAKIIKDICPEDTNCCTRVLNEEYTSFTVATYFDDFQRALTTSLPNNIPPTQIPDPQNIPYSYPDQSLKWFLDDCCVSDYFCRVPNRYRLYRVNGDERIPLPYFIELVNIIPSTQVIGSIRVLEQLILPIITFYRWDYMKAGDQPRIDVGGPPEAVDTRLITQNRNNPSTASKSTVIMGRVTGYTGLFERGTRPTLNQTEAILGNGNVDTPKVAIQTIFWNLNHDNDSYCDILWAVDIPTARSNIKDPIPTVCAPLAGETAYRMTNTGFYGNTSGPPADFGGPINDNGGVPPIAPPIFTNGNVLLRSKGRVSGSITVKYVKISGFYNVIRFFDNTTTNLQTAIQANELLYRDWIRVARQQAAENEFVPLLFELEKNQRYANNVENQVLNPNKLFIINLVVGQTRLNFPPDTIIPENTRIVHAIRKLFADTTESSVNQVFVESIEFNSVEPDENGDVSLFYNYHIIVQTNDIYNPEAQFLRTQEVQRQLAFLEESFSDVKDHYPPLHLADTIAIVSSPEAFILRDNDKATFRLPSTERIAFDRQQEAQLVQFLVNAENNNRDPLRERNNGVDRSNAFFQIAGINSQNQQRWLEQQVNRLATMSETPIPILVPTPEMPFYRFRDGTPVSGFLQNAFTTGMTLPLNPPPPLVGPTLPDDTRFVNTNMNFIQPITPENQVNPNTQT